MTGPRSLTPPSSHPGATSSRRISAAAVVVLLLLALSGCTVLARAQAPEPAAAPTGGGGSGLTADDGYIPDGQPLSPFDGDYPAIANLDPGLRKAIQDAARKAGNAGVEMVITTGWRSKRYQRHLLEEGIKKYGSEEEARKWVNTPEKSTHVKGLAVDVGPTDADSWLSQHGGDYGLCQIYANEMWHYELATAPGGDCPAQISDASAG